ncbi:putative protein-disulfide isomerase [Pasteurella testudinis DSM 23072]|uniref:DSBA-like thioredoxin domain-containing protein n=1 Tax=Pasteurella testudinis DSM 23072 TaxID=1122938 RepID=A0A1W1V1K4_9PAST|nr:DsbA family protein [Pasteurella testudinis]SMB87193.1 putative protein-disulfide isomerase [Pasteurella testudinis DSM 23072]SUB50862.1 Protein-disulfide isomerase [Pasteurella testudinis]
MAAVKLTYLFDPLCGWCYGASPAVSEIAKHKEIELQLLPTGLFSGGERSMNAEFSQYAWSNDQRIQTLTGQLFSDIYYQNVLQAFGTPFNSFAMVQALTAVQPEQRLTALSAMQQARYVAGRNVTDLAVLAEILRENGFGDAAEKLFSENNKQSAVEWIQTGQQLAAKLGIQGVPALLLHTENGEVKVLPNGWLYQDIDKLAEKINAVM